MIQIRLIKKNDVQNNSSLVKISKLNESRIAPTKFGSKDEQRDDYYSKNYGKLFKEVVDKLESQGKDVFIDRVDGYAWITDGEYFTYNGRKYNEVDELVMDILNDEFNKKYG